jgi:putative ABC transport system substrate-binding protein
MPEISRLAVLINPSNPNKDYFGSLEVAARKLGVKAYRVDAREAKDFEQAFAPITRNSRSALIVQPDAFLNTQGARIAALATARRVPAISSSRSDVEAGGLMSYGPDLVEHYSGAATYVDKILKGKSRRSSGSEADEIRVGSQYENRQGARDQILQLDYGAGDQGD